MKNAKRGVIGNGNDAIFIWRKYCLGVITSNLESIGWRNKTKWLISVSPRNRRRDVNNLHQFLMTKPKRRRIEGGNQRRRRGVGLA